MACVGRVLGFLVSVSLAACSPALNWREARFGPSVPLRMLMPCKPDRAQRQLPMGERVVDLQMLGCDADGATVAVSHVLASAPDDAAALLTGWKVAVLRHLHAQGMQEMPWTVAGGWPGPASIRLQAQGRRSDGSPLALHAAWFAVGSPEGLHIFHAIILAPQPRPDVAEAFWAGLAAAP